MSVRVTERCSAGIGCCYISNERVDDLVSSRDFTEFLVLMGLDRPVELTMRIGERCEHPVSFGPQSTLGHKGAMSHRASDERDDLTRECREQHNQYNEDESGSRYQAATLLSTAGAIVAPNLTER